MHQIPGYEIVEQLYSGDRTAVYRAVPIDSQTPVVLKFLQKDYPTFSELVQFRNQYTLGKNLDIPGTIKTYNLEFAQNRYILSMEDFGGISLAEYLTQQGKCLPIEQFLNMACHLASILQSLHQQRIIHKDIKPRNILINPNSKEIKITDFSISSLLPRETQEIQNPNVLEGTLAYISPEQTGRMNRGIDYRTDFYSLGVTFYEILTGQLPFITEDAMELVHCHLAKQAGAIHEIKPEIPVILSQIVSKLMAKNAEDRYQSAFGLRHDLEICLTQLRETGKITDFELGQRDLTDAFIIPEKLYGRETEVEDLLAAFERVSEGSAEMMLVAGFSGIGKTAVVNEVHKPIVRQRGYFVKGKYDQFQRNIPFSAFVQAFRDLMGQLLSESEAQLQVWKSKILEAVGDNGLVLIEVIPELERIIGSQPPATELSGSAAQNRFNLLMQKFIKVFTSQEHPLVMFLDDLQWSDSASLNLLQLLMEDTKYLLILGAYRDNEVSTVHPFITTVNDIVKAGATVNTITLQPLSLADVNRLVSDTLNCEISLGEPLTELVYQKTKGNPFFATQFLKALHGDKLISFDWNLRYWQCDIAQVRALAITDDVVEFMALQLQKLPPETQDVLKLAACIGAQFDLDTLAIVSEQPSAVAATALWKSLQSGLVLPTTEVYKFFTQSEPNTVSSFETAANPTYRFLHDRVQQAAYSLIPDDKKQIKHYQIGQLLLQQIPPSAREDRIFEIINQLNHGTALIIRQTERDQLAQLNLTACRKARAATAYQAAREYVAVGLSLLGEAAWQQQYEMTLSFHELAAEVAMLGGDFEAMEQFIDIVIQRAHSLLEQINVYRIRSQSYALQSEFIEVIAITQRILQQLGVTFPETPTPTDIQQHIQGIRELIGERRIEDLVHLDVMTDKSKLAIVQIASSSISAAYITGSPLLPLLVSLSVKLSIQYGNTSVSAFHYAMYGIILCNTLKDVDTAVQFGQLALQVVYKLDAKTIKSEVVAAVGGFILHRNSHTKETLPVSQEGYATGLEVGNLEFAGNNAMNFCYNSFWSNQPLATLEQETRTYCNSLVELHQLTSATYCQIIWQTILNLLGFAERPWILLGEALQETEFLPMLLSSANDLFALHCFYLYKMTLCFWFGEIEQATNYAVEVRRYLIAGGGAGFVGEPAFYLYDSLITMAMLSQRSNEVLQVLEQVAQNQTQLQHWAHYAPMNHQHKVDLVEAEKYRTLGQKTEAMEFYDKAISGAKENEYIQEEALANELAAKFYLDWNKEKVAQAYMLEAYYCYTRWGAKAKVIDLETRYPQLLTPILQQPQQTSQSPETTPTYILQSTFQLTQTPSSKSISDALDLTTVLRVSQAISSEIELDKLIATLLQAVQENSGATKSALLLKNHENIELVALSENATTQIIQMPLSNCTEVPIAVINYVNNTQETIVIDRVATSSTFSSDPYLKHQPPQSLMCVPLVSQGTLMGMIYLENNLAINAFTSNRLALLQMLTGPAAIALENARLYHQAQQALTDLKQAQLQIVQSEKMSALGNLVAGVAHEINNPVGFLSGNIQPALDYIQDLFGLLDLVEQESANFSAAIKEEIETIELEYIREDLPKLVGSMREGVKRIQDISTSLRTFSRADSDRPVPFNLHSGIDSTILILKHRLKPNENRPEVEIIKNYGQIPMVECYAGQLNQVFMNILANAIDALDESNRGRSYEDIKAHPNCITVSTSVEDKYVKVAIADNGTGMPSEVKQRIFDHLFTTKAVGKGTGLGLAIARQIIVEKHGGAIEVDSVLGQGTAFAIILPIAAKPKSIDSDT